VVVLVPRGEGVETRPIHTLYSMAAGTAYVNFDNVSVPYKNTLGPDNGGLQVIMSNFNHERSVSKICCFLCSALFSQVGAHL